MRFLLASAVIAAVVIGLVQASGGKPEPPPAKGFDPATAQQRLAGAPPALAALHAKANRVLDEDGFAAQLKALRGYPVVINKWGSWCTPCRAEFPVFQRVSVRKGKTVAFLGLDGGDNRLDAEEFLKENPVSYPSFYDPKERLARSVDAPANYPMTIFVDERGKVVFPHAGPYRAVKELEADIKRYLGA